jgi:exosortase/archaeosortase
MLTQASSAELARFSPGGLILASVAHLSLSVLVGIVYAALLPIFSRRPIVTAVVSLPVLMSGITWALLRAVNPLLDQRIEWTWFGASQVAFGVVAGWVVSRTEPIATAQSLPLAVRAGLEVGGGDHP